MKYSRHSKILEIIEKYPIETQEELAEKLKEIGMDVTQATVSRDIKELRLVKVMDKDGNHRYSVHSNSVSGASGRLMTIFSETLTSCDYANNIVVLKTLPGMAQAAASAIDAMNWAEIVGTIAGDDTVMIVCRAEKIAEEMTERFNKMIRS
ncbi:MAG TPA: arginine repressor [Clostridia bacterium]